MSHPQYQPPVGGEKHHYPEFDETDCVHDGEVYPEHDYPPEEEGNECRRCGAEAE